MLKKTAKRTEQKPFNRQRSKRLGALSYRFLTFDPRTLPKPGSKIKGAALWLLFLHATSALAQAHRNLPNAALVEPQKFAEERAVLKWEVRTPATAFLVTAYDMDGRKKWGLRTSDGRLTINREKEAFEVLVTPVQTGVKPPDWVALEDPSKSGGAAGAFAVLPLPASSVWAGQTPVPKAVTVESSVPASLYLGPTASSTPVAVQSQSAMAAARPPSTPVPVTVATALPTPVGSPAPVPAAAAVGGTPVASGGREAAAAAPNNDSGALKGGIFGLFGGVGRGLLSLTRADLDLTTAGPEQTAGVAALFPFGGWGVQTLWFQGSRLSQSADFQAGGAKGATDVNFTGALADISLSFNLATLAGAPTQFFLGGGPLIASSQSPGLPTDFEQSNVLLPTVEKNSRIAAGGTALVGWRGKGFTGYLQGNYETDAADVGQTLVGRVLLSFRIEGAFSALLGMTVDEERLSLCRGSEDHCKVKGNTRIRLTQANAMMGIGSSW